MFSIPLCVSYTLVILQIRSWISELNTKKNTDLF